MAKFFTSTNILGLMVGIQLSDNINVQDIIKKLRDNHNLLTLPAANNTLRLLPPLIVKDENIIKVIDHIKNTL